MLILIFLIIFGVVYLIMGLVIKVYVFIKNGYFMDVVYDVFLWYLILVSLILFIFVGRFEFSEFIKNIFIVCVVVGMLGIVVFGVRDVEILMGRIGGGIYLLYGVILYIGDFVFYLRFMVLGLVGGFIVGVINIIVRMFVSGGIFGIILGIVIFVFG